MLMGRVNRVKYLIGDILQPQRKAEEIRVSPNYREPEMVKAGVSDTVEHGP